MIDRRQQVPAENGGTTNFWPGSHHGHHRSPCSGASKNFLEVGLVTAFFFSALEDKQENRKSVVYASSVT